jgi:hypothetical protein
MGIFDIKKYSVSITPIGVASITGTKTISNWGEDKANLIMIEPVQPEANIVKIGADGSSSTFRQYDTTNWKLTIKVKVDSADDLYLKNIMALELAGSSTIFTIACIDEVIGDKLVCVNGSFGTMPSFVRGTDMDINREYVFNLPESIYTPPTI